MDNSSETGSNASTKNRNKGSVITFHNLEYAVPIKSGCCKSTDKVVINDIDGMFKPGMNAIMGPTGSGKTSLLDIIAGRKDPIGFKSGQLLIDGNPQPKNFKCVTGYVVQDDVVMGTLTVRENFMFSANVRLPSSVSKTEKKKRVQDTINELGLTHCADTKLGTPFIRGVSGGERKRTNIGMELIIAPSVLFLDEPTTGLDASTSYAVMSLLHKISRGGRTVIFSIHQPRYSIYKLCDTLMLLAKGQSVYHGPAEDALEFFSSIGYDCEEHDNPADFFLDVINGDSSAVKAVESKEAADTTATTITVGNKTTLQYANGGTDVALDMREHSTLEHDLAEKITQKYKASKWHKDLLSLTQPIVDDYLSRKEKGQAIVVAKGEYAASFLTQLIYVSGRTALNLVRNPMASILQIILMAMLGVIVGGLYFDLEDTVEPGIQNRYGLFFFLIMNQIFSNLSALEVFINERAIFIHENASGFYRVSVYFIAKIVFDLLPMRILPLCTFLGTSYFMTGLTLSASKFFLTFLVLFCVSVTASGTAFFFGAAVGVFAIANLLCVLTYIIMMIFGGLLVNVESLWVGIRWIQYISVFRYGLFALSIIELKGLEFYQPGNGTQKVSVGYAGEEFLQTQGINYASDWDFWQNLMALALIACFFFTMSYIMLRRVKKFK